MPKRLNSSIPITDIFKSCQAALLSPNQWAVHCPDPTKVLRLSTNGLLPVDALHDLKLDMNALLAALDVYRLKFPAALKHARSFYVIIV